MRETKIEDVQRLLFVEFMPLFHRKIGALVRMEDDLVPRCNKSQKKALFIIDHRQKITPTDLGYCLDLRKGGLSTLIDTLEQYQLVTKTMDTEDKRKTWLSLTKQGEAYLSNLKRCHFLRLIQQFEKVPDDTLDQMINDLNSLVNHLKEL